MINVNADKISTEVIQDVSFEGIKTLSNIVQNKIYSKLLAISQEINTDPFNWDRAELVNDLHNYRKLHLQWNNEIKTPSKRTFSVIAGAFATSVMSLIFSKGCDQALSKPLWTIFTISLLCCAFFGYVGLKFDRKYVLFDNQKGYIDLKLQRFFEAVTELKLWYQLSNDELIDRICQVKGAYRQLSFEAQKLIPSLLQWEQALNSLLEAKQIQYDLKMGYPKVYVPDPFPSSMNKLNERYIWTLLKDRRFVKEHLDSAFNLISSKIQNGEFSLNPGHIIKDMNIYRKIMKVQVNQLKEAAFNISLGGMVASFSGGVVLMVAYQNCTLSQINTSLWIAPLTGLVLAICLTPFYYLFKNKENMSHFEGYHYATESLKDFVIAVDKLQYHQKLESEELKLLMRDVWYHFRRLPPSAKRIFPEELVVKLEAQVINGKKEDQTPQIPADWDV